MKTDNKNVVVIFAKKPELGKTKSRIAVDTSPEFALDISNSCFQDLVNSIRNSDYYDLLVAVDTRDELSWFEKNFKLYGVLIRSIDQNNDTGGKIHNTFKQLLNKEDYNYEKAILIPMDLPFITEEDLVNAFARMENSQYVFGPEINGGIYLIGIKNPYNGFLFKDVRFSTSQAFTDLLKNSGSDNTVVLKHRNDLNTFQDILNARAEIAHRCPILYKLLNNSGYYQSVQNKYVDFDTLPLCIPVVSVIVYRIKQNKTEILMQIRYKPSIDPVYSGLFEIPSGIINKYEYAPDAAIREVKEETGLDVSISGLKDLIKINCDNNDLVVSYQPFCCNQQLMGSRSYLSVVFLCEYKKGELSEAILESRNPRWLSISEVNTMINKNPEKIFPLNLPVLKHFIKSIEEK